MSKEVVYIDVNDDITSLIEKIKQSPEKIVALIPAKEIGLLQSVINLQLLARISKKLGKHIVIITSKESLMKLAAIAKIPIAKTLQSKPVLTKLPASKLLEVEEFIDGETLPIGELANLAPSTSVASDEIISDPSDPTMLAKPAAKSIKVPTINKFRKKFLLFAGMGVLLIGFLVWALIFAPSATVVIEAKTKTVNVDSVVKLTQSSDEVDIKNSIIHAQIQELDKKRTLEFAATGEKNLGTPAAGTMTLVRILGGSINIPAGSKFTASGCTFVSSAAATLPGRTVPVGQSEPVNGQVTIKVTATQVGDACNLEPKSYQLTIDGASSAQGSEMSGGTNRLVKIVTQDDIEQATQKLANLGDDNAKKELISKFDPSAIVISESLIINQSEVVSSIAADGEAPEGKAIIEQPVNYKLTAVIREQLVEFVKQAALKDNKADQKFYETGDDQIQFANFAADDSGASVKVITQVKVGPNISVNEVKEFAKGKTFGEIQTKYEAVAGVKQVEVTFRPIWVRRVPNNKDKIDVELKI